MPRPRSLALAAVFALGLGSLGACGDDDDAGTVEGDDTEQAPEDVKVPMAEVLAGLPGLVEHGNEAASLANLADYQGALDEYEELHELWEGIEGTIKDTDRDIYERIETAQGLIKDGAENDNAERVQQGADDQAAAVADFQAANG